MFNNAAVKRLKALAANIEEVQASITSSAEALYQLRQTTAETQIRACERYLSQLANAPKELDASVAQLKLEFASFSEAVSSLEAEAIATTVKVGGGAATGVAAGVGVAALAPTAAMAIATTFGTASTGTAIASLSGAAATNAALAWLGGGALAAGGGGMAAGNVLLALAGPVGWAIGGFSLAGATVVALRSNSQLTEKANAQYRELFQHLQLLQGAVVQINDLLERTRTHSQGIDAQLSWLAAKAPTSYDHFNTDQKLQLGALINNINSLSQLLNRRIDVEPLAGAADASA